MNVMLSGWGVACRDAGIGWTNWLKAAKRAITRLVCTYIAKRSYTAVVSFFDTKLQLKATVIIWAVLTRHRVPQTAQCRMITILVNE